MMGLYEKKADIKELRRLDAMSNIRYVFPAVAEYGDLDIEQLVEIMQKPVRAIHTCYSKGQIQTLCIQLLTQNLTLKAEVKRLKNDET